MKYYICFKNNKWKYFYFKNDWQGKVWHILLFLVLSGYALTDIPNEYLMWR